jgi:transcriptional regulator with XRE-family HTH domain
MDLGLLREEVAHRFGLKAHTIALWELDLRRPSAKYLPSIILFLGYDPVPEVTSLPKRLKAARRRLGLSQRELGRRFGIDPKTICKWETGRGSRKTRRMEQLFEGFVREVEAASPEGVVYGVLIEEVL